MNRVERASAALVLLAIFVWQVVTAGLSTAWSILRPGQRPEPALLRVGYDGISPFGAAVLACLVTLTPGTTAIDLDLERRTLLLHLLDGSQAGGVADHVHRWFERRLRLVFPEEHR